MAIVKTGDMYGQVGRLGQNVYYTAYSETRSRKLAASVTNPRTQAQMLQRVRWANLVNFYRVNKVWMKYAFETKKKNQSEYNKFMSLNVATSQIYLTKQEASGGACVLSNYLITQGSLPSIEHTLAATTYNTNLYLPANTQITGTTTVQDLSNWLVANNPALRYGDQLSFIRLYQQANAGTGTPFVVLRKYELILSSTNTAAIGGYLPMDIITSATVGGKGMIVVNIQGRTGGISFVLSRTIGGKTYVSTQRLMLAGMDSMISAYSSQNQLQNAINSYGESQEAFLTSTYARRTETVPVALNILSIIWDHGEAQVGGFAKVNAGETTLGELDLIFNGPLGEYTNVLGTMLIGNDTVLLEGGGVSNETIVFNDVDFAASDNDRYIKRIEVTVNGVNYVATFSEIIRNEDTIQGLE